MPSIINIHSGFKLSILEQPFWHLVQAEYAWVFHNNVRVGCGALASVSALIHADPSMAGGRTPYSFSRRDDSKERLLERVRSERFAALPTRLKSLFVFDDCSLVERAQHEWFSDSPKLVYECRVAEGAITHRADAQLLNAQSDGWEENANLYWSGSMTAQPFPEILVRGTLYFPNWQSFPTP